MATTPSEETIMSLINLAAQALQKFLDRRNAAEEDVIQNVIVATDVFKELTVLHIKAINSVCSPVLNKSDLRTTCERYIELVDDPTFPTADGEAYGTIDGVQGKPPFKSREMQ